MTVDSLRPAAAGVAAVFAGLVPVHLFVLPGDAGVIMGGVAGAISLIMLVLWYALNSDLQGTLERHAQKVGGGIGLLCAAETTTHVAVVGEPWVTTASLIVVMASGACISSRAWSAVVIVATDLAWLGVALSLGFDGVWAQAGAQLLAASLMGGVLNVIRHTTVARLEAATQAVADMAVTDDLTGLGNRRGLLLAGEPVVEISRRARRPVTVLYMDVDGLKEVNDEHGHGAGDRLIVRTGEVLRRVFRDADVVARLGGDEFAVLLSGVGPGEAADLRDGLRERLAAQGISASVGVAHLEPGQVEQSLEQLVDQADLAMYEVKRERRAAA
jgi:diguanylate cyclase (GGDEF)-like protein